MLQGPIKTIKSDKMDTASDDAMLQQALLTPSGSDRGTLDGDALAAASPLDAHTISPYSRSFNETSFSFRNFLFGRSVESPSRVIVRRQLNPPENEAVDDSENEGDGSSDPSWLARFNSAVQCYRVPLFIAIVLAIWPLGFRSFVLFQRDTDATFAPILGSPSAVAQDAFRAAYAEQREFTDPVHPPLVVVLTATDHARTFSLTRNGTEAYAQGRNFSLSLLPYLQNQCCWTWPDTPKGTCTPQNDDNDWLRVTSFYSLVDDNLGWIARGSMAVPDGSSILVQVEYALPANESKHHKRRILDLMDAIDDYKTDFWKQTAQFNNDTSQQQQQQYFTVHYTGIKYFSSDLALSTRRDLMRMDMLVLPLALVLIGIVLPSANPWAIWVIPVVTMMTTVSVWSIIMLYVVTPYLLQISTFTPTIMMSLTLGMGIDYTLFLLARYLEEMVKGSGRKRAIRLMLAGSGHVLVLSGLTLAATFGGLVFLPLSMLKSVGVGAATAILSALAVNLVTVPALLYTPLGLWIISTNAPLTANDSNHQYLVGDGRSSQDLFEDAASVSNGGGLHDDDFDVLLGAERRHRLLESAAPTLPLQSIWFRLSKQLLHPYRGIIILLVTFQLLLPVAHQSGRIKSSISFDLLLPAESPSLQTFHALGKQVGFGSLNPYRILFDGHDANVTMTSEAGFEVMHLVLNVLRSIDQNSQAISAENAAESSLSHKDFVDVSAKIFDQADAYELVESKKPRPTMYNGISVLQNTRIPYGIFLSAKFCSQLKPHCPFELLHVVDALDELATSRDEYATFISATLGSSPFSDEGVEWLKEARASVDHLESVGALLGVKIYIEGSAGIAHDAVDAVYSSFPAMIVITAIVVFFLMGIFFKSVFPPIRSIVSISLTLAFSFGLSVLVFQDGVWNSTHFRAFTSVGDEVCWLVPIMSFSIVVGLALDYDVFLIYRILEYRLEGYEHRSSVALGLDATGGIITAAGVIMAVAFGSLMFSSNPVLYQWSFLVTSAVLLDTFVVRTIIVPILTGLAGQHCWWPRRLPDEQICFEEFRTQQPDDVAGLLRTLEASSEYEPLPPLR